MCEHAECGIATKHHSSPSERNLVPSRTILEGFRICIGMVFMFEGHLQPHFGKARYSNQVDRFRFAR